MKLVYIAGPYRAADQAGVEENIRLARQTAVALLRALHHKPVVEIIGGHGYDDAPESRSILEKMGHEAPFPVIPHMNTALFDYTPGISGIDADYWLRGTMRQMRDCSYVILTRPDAAEKSIGTRNEVYEANRCGIPVFDSVPAFLFYLKDEKYHGQVEDQVKRIMWNPTDYRVGKTMHIFGSPLDESQPSL
jgi:hypothetical protein